MARARAVESAKLRRTMKNRSRLGESVYSGGLVYGKLFLAWIAFISADFLIGFRFELLWPFWLVLRSIYDSFHYQGWAFSFFFICVTATSDLVCFLFIPVQLLLFAASTYVWMQYVWHAGSERGGLCTTTIALWLLFMAVEYSWRLRDGFRGHLAGVTAPLPLAVDLCRPFAAHCIGYPVVTLGFGIKSYLGGWRLQRRQREVAKDNEVYGRILTEALPAIWEPRPFAAPSLAVDGELIGELEMPSNDGIYNGVPPLAICSNGGATRKSSRSSLHNSTWRNNGMTPSTGCSANGHIASPSTPPNDRTWMHRLLGLFLPVSWLGLTTETCDVISSRSSSGRASDDDDDNSSLADDFASAIRGDLDGIASRNVSGARARGGRLRPPSQRVSTTRLTIPGRGAASRVAASQSPPDASSLPVASTGFGVLTSHPPMPVASTNASQGVNASTAFCSNNNSIPNALVTKSPSAIASSESKESGVEQQEMEKLRSELRTARCVETELRSQLNQLTAADRQLRQDAQQSRQKHDQLETKLQNVLRAREQEKNAIQTLEKRLVEAQKQRADLEKELNNERKTKQRDEAAAARALANASKSSGECGESCRSRRRDMEMELKTARKELRARDEQIMQFEEQFNAMRLQNKDSNNAEVLLKALATLKDKNEHLEHSLSAENRLKQDLFRALGDAKSRMESLQGELSSRDVELKRMRGELAKLHQGEFPGDVLGAPLTPSPPLNALQTSNNDSNMQLLTSALANVAAATYLQHPYGSFASTSNGANSDLIFDPTQTGSVFPSGSNARSS